MKRIIFGKSIFSRGIGVLLPRFALKLPLNLPSRSFVPTAHTRKNLSARAAVPSVQTERVWRRLLDGSRPVFFHSMKRGQFFFGKREVSAASGVPAKAASRISVFVACGRGLGNHTSPSLSLAGSEVRDGKLRRAVLSSNTALRPVPDFSRQRFLPVAEGRHGEYFLKALPVGVANSASPMLHGAQQRGWDEERRRTVFSSKPGSVSLPEMPSHRFFSTRQAPINARKSKNSSAKADGMAAAPPSILGHVARMRSLRQDAGRNGVISVVPDFLVALRRDHALARQSGTLQEERSTAVDRTGHFGDIMEMPRGQEKASDLSDESFRMNALRTRSAAVDEIAVPQYPNMSFGFM